MAVVNALETLVIVPVVKDPTSSARLAGFGILNNQQSIWVHKDEEHKAIEVFKSLNL